MALLELVLVGGAAYTGIQAYRQRTQKRSLVDRLQEVAEDQIDRTQTYLDKLDKRYQTFIQTRIDPLLEGQTRRQQMELLTSNVELQVNEVLTTTDAKLNRLMAASFSLMGIATLSSWLFPPLLLLTAAGTIYLTWFIYAAAYRSLRQKKRVTTELISALYVSGMWLAGYFVFGAVICFFYFLEAKVLFRMEGRSRQGFTSLFGQQSRFAWRVVDGVEVQIPVETLQAGDIIVVNAGEPIPVDGVIIQGMALIDQQHLTGEAQPAERGVGEPVLAATLLLTGRIWVAVAKAGSETTAAQITAILEQTANHQTALVTRGQQIADRSALPTLSLSLLAFPLRGFVGAVAVLGSGFGFNLRTCSLLSMFNYLQIAARNAILVKDGRALEQLSKVDTLVFDKTGTLTLEQPQVAQVHCCHPAVDEARVLTYAAAAEYRQPHPIAKAILAAAAERQLLLPAVDEAGYEVGFGIQVTIDQQRIRVGSERFMQQSGIIMPVAMQTVQATCRRQGHSLVMVARDDALIGALELHATPRPEVQAVLADLRHRNLHLAIISGDQEEPTRQLANTLGIESYFANTLPENKAALIAQLQSEGRVVCFIGDGINDAIALQQADVSISLRGATTIATDTAQIVLMDQSLAKIGALLDLANNFNQTVQQAFWTTMLPGVISIGGVFFLHFGIIAVELLFQLGFFTGLGTAMLPLLQEQSKQESPAS